MSIYAQIQTYATCDQQTFTTVLQRFADALSRLGCTDRQVLDWLVGIRWPATDDDSFGDVYAAPLILAPTQSEPLTCSGIEVSLYADAAVPHLDDPQPWLGFNLLLDGEEVKPRAGEVYRPGVGRALWQILYELALVFPEIGAYLTDEWQDNLTWRVIAEKAGDPWTFDLGIFPRSAAKNFIDVPAGFQGTVIDGAFGFALANRWSTLPWEEEAKRV